jgi:uncharacterized protein YndB with AHSA1/START domain
MSTENRKTIVIHRAYAFTAEEVFDAWVNPDVARTWLFLTPTGELTRVEMDARVGGKWIVTRRDGENIDHVGEYLEVDRPHRLVFTFGVPHYSSEMSIVKLDIVSTEGGCELTLTQEEVLPEWAEPSIKGWTMLLDALNTALTP